MSMSPNRLQTGGWAREQNGELKRPYSECASAHGYHSKLDVNCYRARRCGHEARSRSYSVNTAFTKSLSVVLTVVIQ